MTTPPPRRSKFTQSPVEGPARISTWPAVLQSLFPAAKVTAPAARDSLLPVARLMPPESPCLVSPVSMRMRPEFPIPTPTAVLTEKLPLRSPEVAIVIMPL